MKKFLLLVLLICGVTVSSFAQGDWAVSYQGELNVGYSVSGKLKNDAGEAIKTNFSRPFVETIQGVRIGDYLYAGVGVSVQYAYGDWVTGDDAENFSDYIPSWNTALMPIFLNLKGYYPVSDNFAPYISLSLGATTILASDLSVSGSNYEESIDGKLKGGFYYDFGVGFNYKKFNFGLGMMHQGLKYTLDSADSYGDNHQEAKWKVNSFYVKVGLKF